MRIASIIGLYLCSLNALGSEGADFTKADQVDREVAAWFTYTTGPMDSERLGQCGDYAAMFVLRYNEHSKANVARLVVANNPIPSGTYRVEHRVEIAELGIPGFDWKRSGFILWRGQTYLFHPKRGTYRIVLEKAWTPAIHFGVNMLDPAQVHVWATLKGISVDPTYFDLWPDRFPSPLGKDD